MANNLPFFGGRKGEKYPLECSIELKGQPLLCPRNINGCCRRFRVFSSLDPLPSSPLVTMCSTTLEEGGGFPFRKFGSSALPDDSKVSAASKLLLRTILHLRRFSSSLLVRSEVTQCFHRPYMSVSGSVSLVSSSSPPAAGFWEAGERGGRGRKGKMKPCH